MFTAHTTYKSTYVRIFVCTYMQHLDYLEILKSYTFLVPKEFSLEGFCCTMKASHVPKRQDVRACVCASVRACVRPSVRACVRASVRAYARASVRECVCVHELTTGGYSSTGDISLLPFSFFVDSLAPFTANPK